MIKQKVNLKYRIISLFLSCLNANCSPHSISPLKQLKMQVRPVIPPCNSPSSSWVWKTLCSYHSGNRDKTRNFLLKRKALVLFFSAKMKENGLIIDLNAFFFNCLLKDRFPLWRGHFLVVGTLRNSHCQSQGTNNQNLKFICTELNCGKFYNLKFSNSINNPERKYFSGSKYSRGDRF